MSAFDPASRCTDSMPDWANAHRLMSIKSTNRPAMLKLVELAKPSPFAALARVIFAFGGIPFLRVFSRNAAAIAL